MWVCSLSCDGPSATRVTAVLLCVGSLLAGCEESLPPRNDPQNYLGTEFSGNSGEVTLLADLSLVNDIPGALNVSVKNLYDEVLQAEEEISIDIILTRAGVPGTVATAHGNRDQILDASLIQSGDLLTIEPESSAVFLIQWDHAAAALWEQTQLTFHTQPGNPSDFSWFESGSITLNAEGSAQLFKGVAPVQLAPVQFTISYTIWVGDPQEVQVDNFLALYDQGLGMVRLRWQTPFEVNNSGFMVERGVSPTEFPIVYNDFIAGQGTTDDTTYYFFLDSMDFSPGLRYYRLQRWYDFGFVIWALDPTHPTAVIFP